jgi:hypothetical protein
MCLQFGLAHGGLVPISLSNYERQVVALKLGASRGIPPVTNVSLPQQGLLNFGGSIGLGG